MCKIIIPLLILLVVSCASEKKENGAAEKHDTLATQPAKNSSKETTPAEEMQLFSGMEQVMFCVLIPEGFVADEKQSDVRAQFVLVNNDIKNTDIEIQGTFRSDESVSPEDYFTHTYAHAEEEGKIIQHKELLKDQRCFFATGYRNNKMYDSRFLEIVWLREGNVVAYTANFPIGDTSLWNNRRKQIIERGPDCND